MKRQYFMILFVFLSGCATYFTVPSEEAFRQPFPPITENVKTTLYRSSFSNETVNEEGMAILGVLKGGPDGLRQNAAFELFQGLRAKFPSARIVPRKDVIQRARNSGRFKTLNQLLKEYQERRVIDQEALREWRVIEGVRYFFIAQVPKNEKHTHTKRLQYGEDGVAGKVHVFSSGPSPISYAVEKDIVLRGEVWDARCGKIVWKGISHAQSLEPGKLERVRVEDLFTALTRNLVAEMDRAMSEIANPSSPPVKGC